MLCLLQSVKNEDVVHGLSEMLSWGSFWLKEVDCCNSHAAWRDAWIRVTHGKRGLYQCCHWDLTSGLSSDLWSEL